MNKKAATYKAPNPPQDEFSQLHHHFALPFLSPLFLSPNPFHTTLKFQVHEVLQNDITRDCCVVIPQSR